MTAARQVVPGRTYLVSRRCTQRQFLLRPDPETVQIFQFCLGEATQRYKASLHGYIALSNHKHLHLRDNLGNLPEFLAHFDKMVAKAMNRHRGRWENFWANEQANAVYLVEPADRFDKLVYLLANPVAAHLVDKVADWPGACSWALNLSARALIVSRPDDFFGKRSKMPTEVTIRLERPTGFEHLSDAEWAANLKAAVSVEEQRAREERHSSGRGIVGREAVLQVHPTERPRTAEPRGGRRPYVACLDAARRVAELDALATFRSARRSALERAWAGERDVAFPVGTYRRETALP